MYESTWMFCVKRILTLPFVLVGVSILTFVFIRFVPVEPAEVILRLSRIAPTPEAIQALREELGDRQAFYHAVSAMGKRRFTARLWYIFC